MDGIVAAMRPINVSAIEPGKLSRLGVLVRHAPCIGGRRRPACSSTPSACGKIQLPREDWPAACRNRHIAAFAGHVWHTCGWIFTPWIKLRLHFSCLSRVAGDVPCDGCEARLRKEAGKSGF